MNKGRHVKTYRIDEEEEALARAAARREGIPLATAARRALVQWAAQKVAGKGNRLSAAPSSERGST